MMVPPGTWEQGDQHIILRRGGEVRLWVSLVWGRRGYKAGRAQYCSNWTAGARLRRLGSRAMTASQAPWVGRACGALAAALAVPARGGRPGGTRAEPSG